MEMYELSVYEYICVQHRTAQPKYCYSMHPIQLCLLASYRLLIFYSSPVGKRPKHVQLNRPLLRTIISDEGGEVHCDYTQASKQE